MKEIGHIYLSWRVGSGHRRHIVGILKQSATKGVRFSYFKEEVEKAKQDGFTPYTEFPEIDKTYTENVLEVFGQRLTKSDRADVKTFYEFWEIKPQYRDNTYYLLAHTQGLLPTDNFEFLADYHPIKDLCFMTDLAGLSSRKIVVGTVKAGDTFHYEYEPSNEYDQYDIKVFKEDMEIGYIKKIHSRVFHKKGGKSLKLVVKAVNENGILKRAFVKVFKD